MSKKQTIHPSIKTDLGYDQNISDKEFLRRWKERSTQVCKPCWELKYCPYGPFVEQSPHLGSPRSIAVAHNEYLKRILETNQIGDVTVLDDQQKAEYVELLIHAKKDPRIMADKVAGNLLMKEIIAHAEKEGNDLSEYLRPPLSNFEKYNVPYPLKENDEDLPDEILRAIQVEIERLETVISTGVDDQRQPLDSARRKDFEKYVREFNPEEYPEIIPQVVLDMECNIFGHICPVVFVGESITETAETRRRGRYIPFQTKMRVVRRDNYTCQRCGNHLRDDEVEFDHIIPHAKGGSCEENNIRLTCYDCNRNKSDGFEL
ncbi:MAG: HNH endonuclease signature motif containing protein [Syntrophales bacterium]